jgi:hypothetical protein
MTTPFGPQLIGETEKTLNALLQRFLDDTDLTEAQWVTLRLARQFDGTVDADSLAATVADRAHFSDAAGLVGGLNARRLLDGGRVSESGRALMASVQDRIDTEVVPILQGLPDADVEATARVLNEVVSRARRALASDG